MATKVTLTHKPEMGSAKSWTFDMENPPWDLVYGTEKATGWAWAEFGDRLGNMSIIALRAMVYVLRKRDEPRLDLDTFQVMFSEVELEQHDPEPEAEVDPKES